MSELRVRRAFSQRFLVPVLVATLTCCTLTPLHAKAESQLPATDHIVSTQALQQSVQKQADTRQQNIKTVQGMFKTPLAQRAMKMEHVDPAQIQKAIPTLSNSELANLSARATSAQQAFAAGRLDNETLLLIIIAMLFIIILVAIH